MRARLFGSHIPVGLGKPIDEGIQTRLTDFLHEARAEVLDQAEAFDGDVNRLPLSGYSPQEKLDRYGSASRFGNLRRNRSKSHTSGFSWRQYLNGSANESRD